VHAWPPPTGAGSWARRWGTSCEAPIAGLRFLWRAEWAPPGVPDPLQRGVGQTYPPLGSGLEDLVDRHDRTIDQTQFGDEMAVRDRGGEIIRPAPHTALRQFPIRRPAEGEDESNLRVRGQQSPMLRGIVGVVSVIRLHIDGIDESLVDIGQPAT